MSSRKLPPKMAAMRREKIEGEARARQGALEAMKLIQIFGNALKDTGFNGGRGLDIQYKASVDGSVQFTIRGLRSSVNPHLLPGLRHDDEYVYFVGWFSADKLRCEIDLGRLIYYGDLGDFLVGASASHLSAAVAVVDAIRRGVPAPPGGFHDIAVMLQTAQTFDPVRRSIGMRRIDTKDPMKPHFYRE